ncbi:MAG: site-specific integrase [Balneolales bacterium]|nr:site-specific integrase [Balneolales bacterium]
MKKGFTWYLRVSDSGVIREKSLGTSSKDDAIKMLLKFSEYCAVNEVNPAELIDDVHSILTHGRVKVEAVTIRESIELFLKEKMAICKPNTVKTYKFILGQLADFFDYDISVRAISDSDIQDYVRNSNWSHATMRTRYRHVKAWWSFLYSKDLVNKKISPIRLPAENHDKSDVMVNDNDIERIITAFNREKSKKRMEHHFRKHHEQIWFPVYLKFMYHSALRRMESLSIRRADIDIEHSCIVVKALHTKSGKSRVIPINRGILDEVIDYADTMKRPVKAPIFVHSADYVYRCFKYYAALANCPEATLHGLRHSRITRWLEMGFSTIEVAQMAGHSNLNVTMNYSHLTGRNLSKKLNILMD